MIDFRNDPRFSKPVALSFTWTRVLGAKGHDPNEIHELTDAFPYSLKPKSVVRDHEAARLWCESQFGEDGCTFTDLGNSQAKREYNMKSQWFCVGYTFYFASDVNATAFRVAWG